jgi:hypothetical protein
MNTSFLHTAFTHIHVQMDVCCVQKGYMIYVVFKLEIEPKWGQSCCNLLFQSIL